MKCPSCRSLKRGNSDLKALQTMIRSLRLFSRGFSTGSPSAIRQYLAKIKSSINEISVHDLHEKLTEEPVHGAIGTHLLDVRETFEWNECHIPTAVYTGRGLLELNIEKIVPDPHDEVILYCGSGRRSLLAAEALQKLGYANVKSLSGGIAAWKENDYAIIVNEKTYMDRVENYN